jgi:hypothetical protein
MKGKVMSNGKGLTTGMRVMVHWDDPPGWYTGEVTAMRLAGDGDREYQVIYDNQDGQHDQDDCSHWHNLADETWEVDWNACSAGGAELQAVRDGGASANVMPTEPWHLRVEAA